jgi:hypothetical protein
MRGRRYAKKICDTQVNLQANGTPKKYGNMGGKYGRKIWDTQANLREYDALDVLRGSL